LAKPYRLTDRFGFAIFVSAALGESAPFYEKTATTSALIDESLLPVGMEGFFIQ
jgi:hypothetical protein